MPVKLIIIITILLFLTGCATTPVEIKVADKPVVTVEGNAPGRTIIYKETEAGVEVTVKDERIPNPLKSLWDTVKGIGSRLLNTADVAIGVD